MAEMDTNRFLTDISFLRPYLNVEDVPARFWKNALTKKPKPEAKQMIRDLQVYTTFTYEDMRGHVVDR